MLFWLLESLLNNPVNQCHILAKNPSTCSLDGRFIVDLSVASIWAFSPSKLSLVLSSILEPSLSPLNNPLNQSPIPVMKFFIPSKNPVFTFSPIADKFSLTTSDTLSSAFFISL